LNWAATRLVWSDVSVKKNETTFKLYRKDPAVAQGKRVCFQGTISVIRASRIEGDGEIPIALGMMTLSKAKDDTYDPGLLFLAARDSGDLVDGSKARFCGFVSGSTWLDEDEYDRPAFLLTVVGMFDLPANRKLKRAKKK
jgi:hypothetical protein